MTAKEKQRELIVEIMKADEQSGLYDEPATKQTAVQWFATKVLNLKISPKQMHEFLEWFEQAKEMEKEQMKDAFTDTHYYTPFDSHVAFEEYYKELYERK